MDDASANRNERTLSDAEQALLVECGKVVCANALIRSCFPHHNQ
jgi:hypothetical protein